MLSKKALRYLLMTLIVIAASFTLVACSIGRSRDPYLVGTWEHTAGTSFRFDDGSMLSGSISEWEFNRNGSDSHRYTIYQDGVNTNAGTFNTFEWYTNEGELRIRSTIAGSSNEWNTRIYEITYDDFLRLDNRNTGMHTRMN